LGARLRRLPPPPVLRTRLATLWRCTYPDCPGYIYDPLLGEERVETPPGVAFEDLTDAFYCPECGSGREVFIRHVDRASLEG
jgi:rubredoxin